MQTRTCPRCSSWFAEDQIDGEFAGMCPRCLAAVLQESHAGVSEVKVSTSGGPAGPVPPVTPLLPGERFGGYEILGVLGQGGMGVVYKARQTSLDRTVALKVLAPRIAGSPEFARRFDHEAKVLASVSHPNVVQVHDFGREGDVHFLVMEYVDGESLEDALRRGRPDPAWILRVLRDVARGLGRVHGIGIVHRDLKPANILIARDGTAKIGDFGLAVESEGVQRLTEQGYFVGTPHYVSPEHAKGEKVDPRSDLYAVGVILFEGFSGRTPFQALSPTAVLVKHIEEPAPPLPNAPRHVQTLVRALLRKNPAERPASAAELEASLDRALAAPPATPVRAARIAIAAAVAAVVLLTVGWMASRNPAPAASALSWVLAASDAMRAGDDVGARRAVDAGLRSGDPTWTAQLGEIAVRLAAMEKERPASRDDEEYGAYLCFSKGDWDRGLPLIAAGDSSPWRDLARKELSSSPDAADVAESWLAAAAKSDKPRWAEKMRERAWAWFAAAGSQERLAELDKTLECRREINLIALANPEKFSVEGEFRVEQGTLRTPPATPVARMAIPYLPPDNYDLELAVERRTGDGPFYVAGVEFAGSPKKLSLSVRRGRVTATADGVAVAPTTRVDRWRTPEPRLLVVGSDASAFVVSRMALRGCPALLSPKASPPAVGAAEVDLLTLIQPARDTVKGPWSLSDGVLACRSASPAILQIPFVPPAEYDLTLVLVRKEGVGSLNIGLAKGDSQFMAVFDGCADQGYKYGLHLVDGYHLSAKENETATKGRSIVNGQTHRIVCSVRNAGLLVTFDGKPAIRWNGNYNRLAHEGWWRVPDEHALFLGAFDGGFRFTEIKLTPRSGQGQALREISAGPVDLLTRIRPAQDGIKGEWKLVDGMLLSPATPEARIELPVEVPAEYDLLVTAERRSTDQRSFHIGLPIGGRGVLVTLDGFGTDRSALENLDGQPSQGEGLTYLRQVFKEVGVPVTVRCEVRRNSLTVRSGDAVVLNWRGDPARLELPSHWRGIHPNAPLLGTFRSEFRIRQIDLMPLSGAARPLGDRENGTDLLALVDPVRDAVAGTWVRSGAGILNDSDKPFPRLLVPFTAPDEYDLLVEAERKEGIRALILGFTSGAAQSTVLIDGWTGTISGIDLLDNKGADTNETSVRGTAFLPLDRKVSIAVSVRKFGVLVRIDGRTIIDWKGDASRLSLHKTNLAVPRKGIFLGAWDSRFLIHRVMLVPASGASRTTDLLRMVDPARDSVAGTWAMEQGELVCTAEKFSRIMIPVEPPDEYDLEAVVERRKGTTFILGIVAGKQVMVSLDSHWNTLSGLDMVDGKRVDQNDAIWRGTLFTDGRPARIVCSVRRTGIQVTFDGKTVIDWKGSRDRLALHPNWGVPKPRVLWIGAWDGVFRIMSLTLSPAGGAAKSETPSGQQDLIASIDPARDSVKGAFSKEGGALMTPRETVFSRIAIPVDVPEEYEVTLEAARRSGGDMLGLGVLQNGRQVMAVVGGQSGETGGLEMLDGLNFMLNKTRFEHPFLEVGKPFTVKVTVRKSGIEVVMNGKRVVAWEGDSKALSLYHEWRVPDRTRLFLASQGSSYEIRRLSLNRLASPGSDPVELMRWIEVPRDSVVGRYQRTDDGILTPWDTPWARLQVPVAPPAEYDLTLQVERKLGSDSLNLGPIWNGRPCTVMIDAAGPEADQKGLAAIDMVDGKEFFRNVTTTKGPFLPVGRKSVVTVSVRKESIALLIDGRTIVELQGSDRARIVDGWRLPNPEALMIGSYGNAQFLIRSIELRPVSGVARRLPPLNAESVDLLKQVELDRDVVSGGWKRAGDAVRSSGVDFFSRVMIPVEPPDEYDVEVDVIRLSGRDDFYMGLVQGQTQFGVMLDAGHSTYSAIQAKIGELGKFEGAAFQDEKLSKVLYRVRTNGLDVRVDGRTLLSYVGNLDRGSMFPQWGVPNKKVLFFGAHNTLYEIRRMRLIPLAPVRTTGAAPSAPKNLLALVDPKRDAVLGEFKLEEGALVTPVTTDYARLQVPFVPPAEYDLVLEVRRTLADNCLTIGLSGGERRTAFAIVLDGSFEKNLSGLDAIAGKGFAENATTVKGKQIPPNQWVKIEISVREGSVSATIDGKRLFAWSGDLRTLSRWTNWQGSTPGAVLLGSCTTEYRIRRLELTAR